MSDIIAIIAIVVSFGGVVFQIVLESMRRRHEEVNSNSKIPFVTQESPFVNESPVL